MINVTYLVTRLRDGIEGDFKPSRERSLALTKLDELELWMTRVTPTAEAVVRDGSSG